MTESKGWDWQNANQSPWMKPTDDVYYLAHKWREAGHKKLLDLGCGLGRHAVFFAQQGFEVAALDISAYGINHLRTWAEEERLTMDIRQGDMLFLPYADGAFDCVFAYHVVSHTDTAGAGKIISEIERVLVPGGEIYLSFSSKDTLSFKDGRFPKVDENTILWTEDGPEKDVPHFHVNREDVITLLSHFELERVRHVDYCLIRDERQDGKYYYINGHRK